MSTDFAEGPVEINFNSPPAEAEIEQVADEGTENQQSFEEFQQEEAAQARVAQAKLEVDQREWNRLQYERRDSQRTIREMKSQLDFVTNVLRQSAEAQRQVEEQEELPDPDDVAAQLKYELAQVKKRQDDLLRLQTSQIEQRQTEEALRTADSHIGELAQQAPEIYTAAMTHLANVVRNDLAMKFPHLPPEEQMRIGSEAINARKRDIVAKGGHVGEEFFKQAMIYGFNPQYVQVPQPQQKQRANGKDQIAAEKKKAGNQSLGGLGGTPAQKAPFSARDAKRVSEKDYHKQMHELVKNNQVRTDKTGRVANMKDLLAGKGVSWG